MSNFIPGPWNLSDCDRSEWLDSGCVMAVDAIDPEDGKLFEVCSVWGINDFAESTPTAMANAHLIAASPDLYKELKHLLVLMEPLELNGLLNIPGLATLNAARAAIAKAEGTSND